MRDEREIPAFEILLSGDTPSAATDPDRPPPDWRKLVAVSGLAGVAIGVVVVVILLSSASEGQPAATTLAPDELASALTVPPTLTPVTEPAVTLPGGPAPTFATEPEVVAATVEILTSREPDRTGRAGFRLSDGSLAALDAPLPRRSVTEQIVGVDGFEQTVTITNDPATGRYLLEIDFGVGVQRIVVDLPGGLTYVAGDDDTWATIPNEEIATSAGAPDMATFLRTMQLGPLRSDTRDAWALVQVNGLVGDTPDEALGEHVVVIDAAAVPEWARYAFGPQGEAPQSDDVLVGYAVYVAEDGSIRRVTGSTPYGATTQRVVHRIDDLDAPPEIDLPVVEPSTTAPPVTAP